MFPKGHMAPSTHIAKHGIWQEHFMIQKSHQFRSTVILQIYNNSKIPIENLDEINACRHVCLRILSAHENLQMLYLIYYAILFRARSNFFVLLSTQITY